MLTIAFRFAIKTGSFIIPVMPTTLAMVFVMTMPVALAQTSSAPIETNRKQAALVAPPDADDVFHFVIYGDRTGGDPSGLEVLKQAVQDTNLLDPDLVMTVGDLIQGYNETPEWMFQMERYKGIMDKLRMRWFPVAGNHDIYWRGPDAPPPGHHEASYEQHFGPLWYRFAHKNAGFIVLYSDEGDPLTNKKAFNVGMLQNMSDEQLSFLKESLKDFQDLDHVFCFLHHPRWIGGGYTGSNWESVHKELASAGNVSAVFAGHIHHMRYDGKRDGIEYYALATTGGHLSADIPDAGYLHHLNMVSVRKDSISVSAIPIGGVIDPQEFTPEFLKKVDEARKIRPVQKSDPILINAEGTASGQVVMAISNPSSLPVDLTLMPSPANPAGGWLTTLDHEHFQLEPGQQQTFEFYVFRRPSESTSEDEGQLFDRVTMPTVKLQVDLLTESSRIRLPNVESPIQLLPGQVPADYFATDRRRALRVQQAEDAVRVDADQIRLPNGPMTLEAWIRPQQLEGYRAIVAKSEHSEYALFCDEGAIEFSIHLDGSYQVVASEKTLAVDRWTHVAGVYTGESVKLFIDGKEIQSKAASGKRKTNRLPLWVGADPDGAGQPSRNFIGLVDETRLSKAAVYEADFEPQRRLSPTEDTMLLLHLDDSLGPFVLDHSNSSATAILSKASNLVPVD